VLATAGRGDGLSVLEEKGGGMKHEEDSALHHLSSSNLVQKAAADCAQDPQCVPVGGICPARMCRYIKRERERTVPSAPLNKQPIPQRAEPTPFPTPLSSFSPPPDVLPRNCD